MNFHAEIVEKIKSCYIYKLCDRAAAGAAGEWQAWEIIKMTVQMSFKQTSIIVLCGPAIVSFVH